MPNEDITQVIVREEREKQKAKMTIRFMTDPEFKQQADTLRGHFALGKSIEEARVAMGKMPQRRWKYLMQAVGEYSVTPEKIFLEYHLRSRHRYSALAELLQKAKGKKDKEGRWIEKPNMDIEAKIILALMKLDNDYINVAMAMGLTDIKPADVPPDGSGYSDEEVRNEIARLERIAIAQLEDRNRPRERILIDVQPHAQPQSPPNRVD